MELNQSPEYEKLRYFTKNPDFMPLLKKNGKIWLHWAHMVICGNKYCCLHINKGIAIQIKVPRAICLI